MKNKLSKTELSKIELIEIKLDETKSQNMWFKIKLAIEMLSNCHTILYGWIDKYMSISIAFFCPYDIICHSSKVNM